MDRPEEVIKTPNQVAQTPHLTEKEIENIRLIQRFRSKITQSAEWRMFQRISDKPRKYSKPLKFDENGKVIVWEGTEASIAKGNVRKGTLRNKKCSCGSGKKYKRCCLNKKING